MNALYALLGVALGFILGLCWASRQIEACQAECAAYGLVCSPFLHDDLNYCVLGE